MGSFYSTCSITKTTLTDQSTYIQLLLPSRIMVQEKNGEYSEATGFSYIKQPEASEGNFDSQEYYIAFEKGLQVSNDGAIANFTPFGFPIKGKYDDYGQIDSYDEDKNIKLLEEFFNMDIENIMCAASRSGWKNEVNLENSAAEGKSSFELTADELIGLDGTPIKNTFILDKLTCTFFRGEIYDFLCKGWNELNTVKGANNWDNPFASVYENIKEIQSGKETFGLRTYLSDYPSRPDFIRMMPYPMDEFEDDFKKQYMFLTALGHHMNYILTPSQYGSQSANFQLMQDMNRYLDKLLTKDLEGYEDWDDEDEQEVREDSLDQVLNDENSKKFAAEFVQTKFGRDKGDEFISIKDIQKMVERAYMAGKENKEITGEITGLEANLLNDHPTEPLTIIQKRE